MLTLSNGATALFNGAFWLLKDLGSPVVVAMIISAIGLGWMASLECKELDRQGTKPIVRRH